MIWIPRALVPVLLAGVVLFAVGAQNAATTNFDLDLSAANPTILADGTRLYLPGDPAAGYAHAGTWWNALSNELGSPISYVSQTGATTTSVHYDPYGLPRPGSTDPAGIGFAGEWKDASGLVDLRFRAYDPLLGRFTGRDTISGLPLSPQSANRYAYALGNPLRYTDPSGHFVNAIASIPPDLWSAGFQMLPGIGDAYSGLTGLIGYDLIAGYSLSPEMRALQFAAMLPLIPGGTHILARLGDLPGAIRNLGNRAADALAESRLGRTFDDLRATSNMLRPRGARGLSSRRLFDPTSAGGVISPPELRAGSGN